MESLIEVLFKWVLPIFDFIYSWRESISPTKPRKKSRSGYLFLDLVLVGILLLLLVFIIWYAYWFVA